MALNPQAIQSTPGRLRMMGKKKLLRLECGRKHYCAVVMGTHALHCTVEGLEDTVAGERINFRIVARDLADEARTMGVSHIPARGAQRAQIPHRSGHSGDALRSGFGEISGGGRFSRNDQREKISSRRLCTAACRSRALWNTGASCQ